MAENEDNDAIIQVADAIRSQFTGHDEFAVVYADLEQVWNIPEGQTEKHIDQAAEDLGYEVTRKGSTRANLRKKKGGGVWAGRVTRA